MGWFCSDWEDEEFYHSLSELAWLYLIKQCKLRIKQIYIWCCLFALFIVDFSSVWLHALLIQFLFLLFTQVFWIYFSPLSFDSAVIPLLFTQIFWIYFSPVSFDSVIPFIFTEAFWIYFSPLSFDSAVIPLLFTQIFWIYFSPVSFDAVVISLLFIAQIWPSCWLGVKKMIYLSFVIYTGILDLFISCSIWYCC